MIKIVTDSTCDLPPDLARQHDITVIPMAINIEGRSYYDGVDITRTEYYQRLPGLKTLPTTAASGAEDFE
jgi:fatty acid-binding protein DegV